MSITLSCAMAAVKMGEDDHAAWVRAFDTDCDPPPAPAIQKGSDEHTFFARGWFSADEKDPIQPHIDAYARRHPEGKP